MIRFTGRSLVLPIVAALFLGGCAETTLVSYAAKEWIRGSDPLDQKGVYKVGNPYQMAIGLGTLIYGFAGLLIVYRIGRDYFSAWTAAAATIFVTIGSFLVWYLAIESSYSHGNSLFTATLFLLIWSRTRDDRTLSQWAWLGLAAGVMTMVRWQNAVFLLFPLTDGLGLVRSGCQAGPGEGGGGPDPGPDSLH